jgi:hypothetical protein
MKKNSSKSKASTYHLLVYVEGCCTKLKKFRTIKSLNDFVLEFQSEHFANTDDNWIDYAVTHIDGEILIYDETVAVE